MEGFPGGSAVKNLPAAWETQEIRETWVQYPGGEGPLEEGTAPHSGILAWRIPWTEEPGGLQSAGSHDGSDKAAAYTCDPAWRPPPTLGR